MTDLNFESKLIALKKRNSQLTGQLDSAYIQLQQVSAKFEFYSTLCWVLFGLLLSALLVIFMVVIYANH